MLKKNRIRSIQGKKCIVIHDITCPMKKVTDNLVICKGTKAIVMWDEGAEMVIVEFEFSAPQPNGPLGNDRQMWISRRSLIVE